MNDSERVCKALSNTLDRNLGGMLAPYHPINHNGDCFTEEMTRDRLMSLDWTACPDHPDSLEYSLIFQAKAGGLVSVERAAKLPRETELEVVYQNDHPLSGGYMLRIVGAGDGVVVDCVTLVLICLDPRRERVEKIAPGDLSTPTCIDMTRVQVSRGDMILPQKALELGFEVVSVR